MNQSGVLAGFPVVSNGEILGVLCVFDDVPLELADDRIFELETLARTGVEDLDHPRVDDRLQPIATSVAAIIEDR